MIIKRLKEVTGQKMKLMQDFAVFILYGVSNNISAILS